MMIKLTPRTIRILVTLTAAASLVSLSACIPLVVGGAVATGTVVATDRRTSGTVVEDNAIDLKASNRISENLGARVHVNVTSYNRRVLLTGEVPSEQDKQLVEKVVSNVENVTSIVNELEIMGASTFGQRSSDALVTSRVKGALLDAKDLISSAFKVTTERGTVYVMGRVTQREANRATEIITGTSGVQKLVRIFDIITEDELARTLPQKPAAVPSNKN
jgi:osmotically-inducible protein OsmY